MSTNCEQVPIFNLVIMLDRIFSTDGNYQFYPDLTSPFHINGHIIEKELTWNWNCVVNDEASFAGLLFLLNVTELKLVF